MSNVSSVNAKRSIPSALTLSYQNPKWGIEVFSSEETLVAMAFLGKAQKASWHSRFLTLRQMLQYIEGWVSRVEANMATREREKQERAAQNAALSAADHFQVGDIVYNSWGYEQTNIDFYLVTAVKNKTIEVRAIYAREVEGSMYGHGMACMVIPGEDFIPNGATYQLKVKSGYRGSIDLSAPKSYYHFSKWSGRPLYMSWYG